MSNCTQGTSEFDLSSLAPEQLENLLRGQVPFVYVPLNSQLRQQVPVIWRMSLDRYMVDPAAQIPATQTPAEVIINDLKTTASDIEAGLAERKIPTDFGIVLVCPDGVFSAAVQKELNARGYLNVLYLRGGVQGFVNRPSSLN